MLRCGRTSIGWRCAGRMRSASEVAISKKALTPVEKYCLSMCMVQPERDDYRAQGALSNLLYMIVPRKKRTTARRSALLQLVQQLARIRPRAAAGIGGARCRGVARGLGRAGRLWEHEGTLPVPRRVLSTALRHDGRSQLDSVYPTE